MGSAAWFLVAVLALAVVGLAIDTRRRSRGLDRRMEAWRARLWAADQQRLADSLQSDPFRRPGR